MNMKQCAMTCSLEACVGYLTAYNVLFKGKPVLSHASQRVMQWCRANGFLPRVVETRVPGMSRAVQAQPEEQVQEHLNGSLDAQLDALERKLLKKG